MTRRVYRLVVTGEMGRAMREAFPEMDVRVGGGCTVLSGELADQTALYSMLDRLHALGLSLVELRLQRDQG